MNELYDLMGGDFMPDMAQQQAANAPDIAQQQSTPLDMGGHLSWDVPETGNLRMTAQPPKGLSSNSMVLPIMLGALAGIGGNKGVMAAPLLAMLMQAMRQKQGGNQQQMGGAGFNQLARLYALGGLGVNLPGTTPPFNPGAVNGTQSFNAAN